MGVFTSTKTDDQPRLTDTQMIVGISELSKGVDTFVIEADLLEWFHERAKEILDEASVGDSS